ncbi:hypothetical protein IMSHALPRED_008015 [Imshaugia aleurites]|uniref:SMP-30/Gluconolactonase/LRE-like region domain-containing protein n=1 Tax=Imshaugia aleurites TaxID=172621 RepID=A0A8H3IWL0_9LECA|nr:hypothetical protein IMSHALPRED_008015 [Imshaugia aleurites]
MECGLGEAPYYESSRHTLRFVDIVKEKLHIVDLEKGPSSLESFDLGTPVSTTADIEGSDGEIIVGAKRGYAIMNRKTKKLEYIKKVWEERDGPGKDERMRFNDGVVDHEGRYWAGTMNDPKVKAPPKNEGTVFRLDADMTLHRMIENVSIPNGICFSLDEKIMYFIDSPTSNVFQFKYDRKTGDISDREVFYHVEGDAVPDGMTMDVNGCLWIAICGGGKVIKVSPDAKVVGEISFPNARMITCPAFVDENLFITSAEEEEPERYPDSVKYDGGSLFRVHVGVSGMPVHKFRGR